VTGVLASAATVAPAHRRQRLGGPGLGPKQRQRAVGIDRRSDGGNIEITNSADIHAGGDGIVATSQVNAAIDQTQDAAQANGTGQTGTAVGGAGGAGGGGLSGGNGGNGGNASVVQASAQSNVNAQSASIGDLTAGNIKIDNSADIHAGGDGIVATSQVNAAIDQTQDAAQANGTEQTGTAVGGAGGAGGGGLGGGDGGDGGDASVEQGSAQSNVNSQSASIGDLKAGDVVITNSGDVHAGRDGIVGVSQVIATVDQSQDVEQTNDTEQTGIAVGGAGGAGGDGIGGGDGGDGGDASVNQASDQSNANAQSASIGDLAAGDVTVINSGNVHAGRDGIVAISEVIVSIEQSQNVNQTNISNQQAVAVAGAAAPGARKAVPTATAEAPR
jgi:hypothetical protein